MSKRKTISLEVRKKIVAAYDKGKLTRIAVAEKFGVSEGMVKKLLQQRDATGDVANLHHRAGRKPQITAAHQKTIRTFLGKNPGATLQEIKSAAGLKCSLQAIHAALAKMGVSRKRKKAKPTAKAPAPKVAAKKKRPVKKRN